MIARNSSFTFKGRAVDVREVAETLGVRYVLEGSVRRAGNKLRITAQLIDAQTGAHIFAQNFDGKFDDVFEFQDHITREVVGVVEPRIRQAEIKRSRLERPHSVEAYDLHLRALAKHYAETAEANAEGLKLLEQATALEPENPAFLAEAAHMLQHRATMSWPPLTGDDAAIGDELVERALKHAGDDATALALCAMGLIHHAKDYERALDLNQRAVEANPNNLLVLICGGIAELHCGDLEKSIAHSRHALRLSPADPGAYKPLTAIAHAHMAGKNYEEALSWAKKSLNANPHYPPTFWMLISGNAQLGRVEEAWRYAKVLRDMQPDVTIAGIMAGQPAYDPSRLSPIIEGLRLAGLPER